MGQVKEDTLDHVYIEEIKLLFEEKRTALLLMRTGIIILIAQLGIFSFLIVGSQYYKMLEVLHLVVPFFLINFGLLFLGVYLVVSSFRRINRYDQVIMQLRKNSRLIRELLT